MNINAQVKAVRGVLIWSDNWKHLSEWYRDTLGLKPTEILHHPKDTGVLFEQDDGIFIWIGKHSKVKGNNKDQYRIMINFDVDSVSKSYTILRKRGVRFEAEPFKTPTFNAYVATFYDLDGNILQIVGGK